VEKEFFCQIFFDSYLDAFVVLGEKSFVIVVFFIFCIEDDVYSTHLSTMYFGNYSLHILDLNFSHKDNHFKI